MTDQTAGSQMQTNTKLGITDVVLRDAHQSLFATRLRLDDMLPIAEKLDQGRARQSVRSNKTPAAAAKEC